MAARSDLPGPLPESTAQSYRPLADAVRDPASFRDPSGFVFRHEGRIRRAVTDLGVANARAVRATGLIERLVAAGRLLPEEDVSSAFPGIAGVPLVLAHPTLPFVSYPYEWPFRLLQSAALLHLDIQLEALDAGVMLTDASAYNVQFIGVRPVFIDHLSFRPYLEGELWAGHRQFCEQFLHPLLLQSLVGIPFHASYRGRVDGLPSEYLLPMLRLRHKIDWKVLANVVLPARLQRVAARPGVEQRVRNGRLARPALRELLATFRRWIARLEPRGMRDTTWHGYDNIIPAQEANTIASFVADMVSDVRPHTVWDLGCNAGRYSEIALSAGAAHAVGLDSDVGALDRAVTRAREGNLALLPLVVDLVNPSPSQGWNSAERTALMERGRPDALLALSVVHHMAIARNVPLEGIVEFLTRLAPEGVVGFVPPTDLRARALFRGRDALFADYSTDQFVTALRRRARIVREIVVPGTDRVLLRFTAR
jgi:ribosomal protein L11 methylase PrmA